MTAGNFCRACLTPLPPGERWCNARCHRDEDGPPWEDDDE